MSANLKPGTLCFLTRVAPADCKGRVVEVIAGPRAEFGGGPGPFYDVRAPWIAERFPGRDLIALRAQLIPLTPGDGLDAAPETRALGHTQSEAA